ncbi:MAG: hypothetical protein Q8L35_08220, partial [Actinomycetota bacterium]|nr:hypothetical protein [Actinomycetota bacterium]
IKFQIASAYTGRLGVDAFWWGYKGNSIAEATYQFNGDTIFTFPYYGWSPTSTDYVSVEWAP